MVPTGTYVPGALYRAWTPNSDPVAAVADFLRRYATEPTYVGPSGCGKMLLVGPIPNPDNPRQLTLDLEVEA